MESVTPQDGNPNDGAGGPPSVFQGCCSSMLPHSPSHFLRPVRGAQYKGGDIGSGPTEAGCKIIGERLKGSGMHWVEEGAATVGALRALYVSGGKVWDGFWSQAHTMAA